jgi:hypothetical protein
VEFWTWVSGSAPIGISVSEDVRHIEAQSTPQSPFNSLDQQDAWSPHTSVADADPQASGDSGWPRVAQMASAQQDNSKASVDAAPVENGQDPVSSPGEDEWDEERLEKAMNTLKEMHIQVGTQGQLRWAYC